MLTYQYSMNKLPDWFQEAYDELTTVREREIVDNPNDFRAPAVELFNKLQGRWLQIVQPNPTVFEGRDIATDPKRKAPEWVARLLGDHGDLFAELPERVVMGLEGNLQNKRAQRENADRLLQQGTPEETDLWRLRVTTNNFAGKLAGPDRRALEESFGLEWLDWRLPLLSSFGCWPLRVRTHGDVQAAFDETVRRIHLTDRMHEVQASTYPNEKGENMNQALNRELFPVFIDMLKQGFGIYPTLIS